MSNEAARHQLADALALAQEQMAGLAEIQRRRAALSARATAADGTVEVTVDAQGIVADTMIDEAYLDDHAFEDLGVHVTRAAQAAAREVAQRSAALLAPMAERRLKMPGLPDVVPGAPDLSSLFAGLLSPAGADPPRSDAPPRHEDDRDDAWDRDGDTGPTVRS